MIAHDKPSFSYPFDLDEQIALIQEHQEHRGIPEATDENLIVATWNLTNFGLQERESDHLRMMAEIIKPFDVVAIQEVADDVTQLYELLTYLKGSWKVVFSDIAGNYERLGYLYQADRVQPTELAAELAMRGYERARISISVGSEEATEEVVFPGFNRNPYMLEFRADAFIFSLVNVHLYWSLYEIRKLEARALAKWAKSRIKKVGPPNNDIILLGDFNMPRVREGDEIYDEMVNYGVSFPKYDTDIIGSNLAGDADYDAVAFFPSRTGNAFVHMGVFDFDKKIFPDLWPPYSMPSTERKPKEENFFQYIRYYLADHRPLWAEFKRIT